MSHLSCSIIIPTWNARHLIKRCLRSVVDAIDADRDEIIVVDDGSTDGTADFIKTEFPVVVIESSGTNKGFGASCNTGVARSRGEVVVLLNNDIIVEPSFLPPLVEHFDNKRIFAVNAQVFHADGSTPGGGLVRGYFHCGLLRLRWSEMESEREHEGMTLYANGAATAIHREKYLELGGFDSLYYPFYSEDLDLSYRAYQRGWQTLYEPRSVVRHDHSVTISAAYDAEYIARISKRNRILFVWRNIHDPRILFQHVIWMFLRVIGALVSLDLVFLKAVTDACRKLSVVFSKRRQAPSTAVPDREILEMTSQWVRG